MIHTIKKIRTIVTFDKNDINTGCMARARASCAAPARAFGNAKILKKIVILCFCAFAGNTLSAQTVKPCCAWLTDFITVAPKMSDGGKIETYVAEKLRSDTSLKSAANCMVGLKIWVNCNGEFSYEKMEYRNNILLAAQCSSLLQATEQIIAGIKQFSPGTIDNQKKDFVFKLVVRITHNGKPKTEILY